MLAQGDAKMPQENAKRNQNDLPNDLHMLHSMLKKPSKLCEGCSILHFGDFFGKIVLRIRKKCPSVPKRAPRNDDMATKSANMKPT